MSKTDEGKSSLQMQAIEGTVSVKNFKTIIKLTESWSTFLLPPSASNSKQYQ